MSFTKATGGGSLAAAAMAASSDGAAAPGADSSVTTNHPRTVDPQFFLSVMVWLGRGSYQEVRTGAFVVGDGLRR